ncbi:hypothetical protein PN36_00785 [Candidatus Thiomargarita nelsonii]|uniref:CHAT domain-containing protein n=1 Tax=Candidatus Thiomargarita nelsonii TaxID=1003181 RepID=A0A0A6RQE8_9GAMM|nr:hypothetical protein PN36_00785 [Candidatus Thiomargarita nelsonii]
MTEEDKEARADSLFEKGFKAYKQAQFRPASEAFTAALSKYEALIAEGRANFRSDCAITRRNLGNCLYELNNLEAARDVYEETLKDYHFLINKEKRSDLLSSYVRTRMNLGFCLYSLGEIEKAHTAYQETLKDYDTLIDKEKHTELRPPRARTRMNLGNCLSSLGDLSAALMAYEETLKEYDALIDKEKQTELRPERAKTRMNLGNCLSSLGELDAARVSYEETLKDYDLLINKENKTELRPARAKTRMNFGIFLKKIGELEAARAAYQETIKNYDTLIEEEKRIDLRPDRARTRMNLGICLKKIGDLEAARSTYEETIKDYDSLINKEKHTELRPSRAITRMNLGNCFYSIGDFKAARNTYEETLKEYERLIDKKKRSNLRPYRAITRMNLGNCLSELGDLDTGRRVYEETLKEYDVLIDKEKRTDLRPYRAITRINLGLGLSELGDLKAARLIYEETLKDYDVLVDKEKRSDLRADRAITRMNLGNCLYESGDIETARRVYEESLKDYDILVDKEKRSDLRTSRAITRLNLGNCLYDLCAIKAGRRVYEETIKEYDVLIDKEKRTDLRADRAIMRMNFGNCLYELDDIKTAISVYEETIKDYDFLINQEKRTDLIPDRAITRMNLGNCLKNIGDFSAAETNYQASLSLLQELQAAGQLFPDAIKMMRVIADWYRNPQRPPYPDKPRAFELAQLGLDWLETFLNLTAKALLLEQNMPLFHLAADLALELNYLEQAYFILERSKSRSLVEQVLRERAELSTQIDEPLRTQYVQLSTRLDEFVKPIVGKTADSCFFVPITRTVKRTQEAQLLQEQAQVEQELDKVRRAIAEQDQAFGEAISPSPLNFEQIARLLPANRLVIAFDQRPDYLHLYAITAQEIHAPLRVELNMQQVTNRVNTFRNNIIRDKCVTETNQMSDWLTSTLGLAVNQLFNMAQPKNTLSNRFGLFSRKGAGNWQEIIFIPHQAWHLLPLHLLKIDGELLVEQYKVRYIPALQILRLLHERKKPAKHGKGCIIANPDGTLPSAQMEGHTIKSCRPDDVLLEGSQASLKTVRQYLETAHHGHFGCHSFFKPNLKAGLKLADGSLEAKELFTRLRLPNPRLVVLSACKTEQPVKPTFADEYMRLISGFLFAGAHSVLAALWQVDDDSTRLLMEDFYQGLAKGLSPILALQRAQEQLKQMPRETVQARLQTQKVMSIKPYEESYYWSGFVLLGDGV